MGFERFVGLRYLMAKRQRNVLSVITLISVAGVAVGVMALIVVLSVMGGFEGDLRQKILGTKSHLVVTAPDGYIRDYEAIVARIRGVEGVIGASPYVEGEVMVNSRRNLQGVVLRGILPDALASVSAVPEEMIKGRLDYITNPEAFHANASADDEPPRTPAMQRAKLHGALGILASEHGDAVRSTLKAEHNGAAPLVLGPDGQLRVKPIPPPQPDIVLPPLPDPKMPELAPIRVDPGGGDRSPPRRPSDVEPIPTPKLPPVDPAEPTPRPSRTRMGPPSGAGMESSPSPVETAAAPTETDTAPAEPPPSPVETAAAPADTAPDATPQPADTAPDATPQPADTAPDATPQPADTAPDATPQPADTAPDATPQPADTAASDDDEGAPGDADEDDPAVLPAVAKTPVDGDDASSSGSNTTADGGAKLASKPRRRMRALPTGPSNARKKVKSAGIVMGKELFKMLAINLGKRVYVMHPRAGRTPWGPGPKSQPFEAVGVFYTGMFEYDTRLVYVPLDSAQRFFNLGSDEISGIEIKVNDVEQSMEIRDEVKAALAGGSQKLEVRDWREMNANLFSALLLEKIAMFIILTFIILVASFSIVCLLIMIVIEKGREIAVLKTMGATNTSIQRIFVLQGGVIGFLGTAIGLGLGLGLCHVIASWGIELPTDVYYLSQIPVEVRPFEVTLICISAIVISLLATIYPAIQAARLNPVEGLRYE